VEKIYVAPGTSSSWGSPRRELRNCCLCSRDKEDTPLTLKRPMRCREWRDNVWVKDGFRGHQDGGLGWSQGVRRQEQRELTRPFVRFHVSDFAVSRSTSS
jgi:hypothetical protein